MIEEQYTEYEVTKEGEVLGYDIGLDLGCIGIREATRPCRGSGSGDGG